jgi:tetratricopeptide (TPR) repeat protein
MREARWADAYRTLAVLLLTACAPWARAATMAELDDAATRIQYAFYTGDARAVEEVLAVMEKFEVDNLLAPTRSYQLAYGYWRLAELRLESGSQGSSSANSKALSAKAAQTCVRHARAAISQDAGMGEVYAIEAICGDLPVTRPLTRANASTVGCARSKSLRTALSLTPDSPRVQLIDALCSQGAATDPAALERWRDVVASFEAAPPSRPGRPDWGHAEALAVLGETYLERGDTLAARDALERALVLAPDFRLAQRLLQSAVARPR